MLRLCASWGDRGPHGSIEDRPISDVKTGTRRISALGQKRTLFAVPFDVRFTLQLADIRRCSWNVKSAISGHRSPRRAAIRLPHGPIEFHCPEWLCGHVLGFLPKRRTHVRPSPGAAGSAWPTTRTISGISFRTLRSMESTRLWTSEIERSGLA